MRLIYGFDPLCGWCFGFVPAMRAVERSFPDLPVTLAMPGLVTGPRVGPYAEMEGYIRSASQRLRDVTGRAPSEAFFDLIRQPGVRGDSTPPIAAITQLASAAPEATLRFAHAVTEAHFETGADLNDHATYTRIATGMGLDAPDFDPGDAPLAAATMAQGQAFGISSFPTLIMEAEGSHFAMPSLYDPDAVVSWVSRAARAAAAM
jgi:putative protein-disulfide isomerase